MIIAAIIEDAIFCVHGGLSPDSYNPEQVSSMKDEHYFYVSHGTVLFKLSCLINIPRPVHDILLLSLLHIN